MPRRGRGTEVSRKQGGPTTRSIPMTYASSAVELPAEGREGLGSRTRRLQARLIQARGTGKTQPNSSKKVQTHLSKCATAHASFLRLEPLTEILTLTSCHLGQLL